MSEAKRIAQEAIQKTLERKRQIEQARANFTEFKRFMIASYQHAPHLEAVDKALMRLERAFQLKDFSSVKPNLAIEMPPRHGKSFTVARLFPAWFLGRNPNARIIIASYGASLSEKHSRFIRNLIRSKRFRMIFPDVKLSEESQARDAWDLAAPYAGGLDAVGKGGALTGKGADLIITDDLVKGRSEAESELLRDQDWEWFQDDLLTRREPNAIQVSIGTRWHQDDVHGRIHELEKDFWDFLVLPALARADDPLGRKIDEPLWAERFPLEKLLEIKQRMGEYGFESLYQQAPFAREGALFQPSKLVFLDAPPPRFEMRVVVRFWDLALSNDQRADYSVGIKMGIWNGCPVILDMVRVRARWDALTGVIRRTAFTDGAGVFVGVERSYYHSQAVKQLLTDRDLHEYAFRSVAVEGDKYTRALPFAARVNEGLCYIVRGDWNRDFIEELRAFPLGAHDDIVDAASGAYNLLNQASPLQVLKRSLAV